MKSFLAISAIVVICGAAALAGPLQVKVIIHKSQIILISKANAKHF